MAYTQFSDVSRAAILGVTDFFTNNFESYPKQYPEFVTQVTSTLETEKHDSMGNIGGVVLKPEGSAIGFKSIEQAYETQIQNKTYANGISFTKESMVYDKYKVTAEAKAKELMRTMVEFEETLAITPYNNAFTVNLADAVPMCSDSKPLKNAAGQFNDTLVTGALTPDNVKAGMIAFYRFKNHAGGPMRAWASKLMTHEVNMFTVEEILGSQNKAYELSNTKNTLPKLRPVYSRYLTSETAWFLIDDNFDHVILQFYQGERNKMDWEEDFDTKNLKGTITTIANSKGLPNIGIVGSLGT